MDYFSLSKVKQKCFQAGKKKERDRKKKLGLKSSSFSWAFRHLEQPLGGADPALVRGCVLPVPSLNTNEEELVMGGLLEKSTVSRQQRTSVRGSVKTSAVEALGRERTALPVFVLDRSRFDIEADLPLSHTAQGYCQ